ncbi:MAG: 4-hydroxy-tetrahydrodipicolinate reductase [Thermoplasmata archaeon]
MWTWVNASTGMIYWKDFTMIEICIAGVNGRMGRTVAREAVNSGFKVVGAIDSPDSGAIGQSLASVGIIDSPILISSPRNLGHACASADVYISFASPNAEMENLPVVADMEIPLVVGTTGFSNEQMKTIQNDIEGKVPAVIAPNFALGVNIFYRLARECKVFPKEYDFSISEIHHTGKKDSPSGTAKKIGEVISDIRGYSENVYGRRGFSPRDPTELEILSMRTGGVPGIHDLVIAGPNEMIRIEHISFSRSVFAQGALYSAEWIYDQKEPGIYSMDDVLDCIGR